MVTIQVPNFTFIYPLQLFICYNGAVYVPCLIIIIITTTAPRLGSSESDQIMLLCRYEVPKMSYISAQIQTYIKKREQTTQKYRTKGTRQRRMASLDYWTCLRAQRQGRMVHYVLSIPAFSCLVLWFKYRLLRVILIVLLKASHV